MREKKQTMKNFELLQKNILTIVQKMVDLVGKEEEAAGV